MGRPEGRCSASWSQGGPCVPSAAAAGEHPLHKGWNAKAERALAQADRGTAGVDLAKPGTAPRLPTPPVGTGVGEGLKTDFPSFAREMGFSTIVKAPLHKTWGGRGRTGGSPRAGRLSLALPAPGPPGDEPIPGDTRHHRTAYP